MPIPPPTAVGCLPTDRLTEEQIREFWTVQARTHRESPSASWSDHRVIELEIAAIGRRIDPGDEVADVGCANGYSSVRYALERGARVVGIDYVEEMIATAMRRSAALPPEARARVEFRVGDVRALDLPDERFDCVVATRVIINLADWAQQLAALRECVRVVRRGGRLLLSEATLQGWRRLNALRREWGLDDIPMPPFNLYVDERQVVEAVERELELEELSNFASSYYVVTRFAKPLLARATGATIDVADPDAELNRLAAQLPAVGDYGTQKLFVFRKR